MIFIFKNLQYMIYTLFNMVLSLTIRLETSPVVGSCKKQGLFIALLWVHYIRWPTIFHRFSCVCVLLLILPERYCASWCVAQHSVCLLGCLRAQIMIHTCTSEVFCTLEAPYLSLFFYIAFIFAEFSTFEIHTTCMHNYLMGQILWLII